MKEHCWCRWCLKFGGVAGDKESVGGEMHMELFEGWRVNGGNPKTTEVRGGRAECGNNEFLDWRANGDELYVFPVNEMHMQGSRVRTLTQWLLPCRCPNMHFSCVGVDPLCQSYRLRAVGPLPLLLLRRSKVTLVVTRCANT